MKKVSISYFNKEVFYPLRPPENTLQITIEETLFESFELNEKDYELKERLSCHYNSFLHPKIQKFLKSSYDELRIFIGYSILGAKGLRCIRPIIIANVIAKHIRDYIKTSIGELVEIDMKKIHTVNDAIKLYPGIILDIEEVGVNV